MKTNSQQITKPNPIHKKNMEQTLKQCNNTIERNHIEIYEYEASISSRYYAADNSNVSQY
jgi:hypothetical protein